MTTKNEIQISRRQMYRRGGNIKFAWMWNYVIHSPGEYDADTLTLHEAEGIAKRRKAKTGFPIVYTWKK